MCVLVVQRSRADLLQRSKQAVARWVRTRALILASNANKHWHSRADHCQQTNRKQTKLQKRGVVFL
jgi:hypothetical protein